jgi:hypothetical protein
VVAFEDRQVLGEERGLDIGGDQDLAHGGGFVAGRQDLEDPDASRVRERLEQVRFDFVERPIGAAGAPRTPN